MQTIFLFYIYGSSFEKDSYTGVLTILVLHFLSYILGI